MNLLAFRLIGMKIENVEDKELGTYARGVVDLHNSMMDLLQKEAAQAQNEEPVEKVEGEVEE